MNIRSTFINLLSSLVQYLVSILQKLRFAKSVAESRGPSAMKVNVKLGSSASYLLDVKKQDDIAQLKQQILKKMKKSETYAGLRIIFAGKELHDSTKLEDYDIGQYSVLHAIKATNRSQDLSPEACKPLSPIVFDQDESRSIEVYERRTCFYVYCSNCKNIGAGKLRVNCATCKQGSLTVDKDPKCWDDVLEPNKISGTCQIDDCDGHIAQFYFKCAADDHATDSHGDNQAVALYLIRSNLYDVSCMICTDVCPVILVFPCPDTHVICLQCFHEYCKVKINERQFVQDPTYGYTLPCPAGCRNSLIKEIHHFRTLDEPLYEKYQRFGAEECLLQAGGLLCPQPGCGAGILPDFDCRKVTCVQQGSEGCGFVFCRNCMQGFHLGECSDNLPEASGSTVPGHAVSHVNKDAARWNEASQVTIKKTTKPCPKCRTPTERDEGCMHMVCMRAGCGFHWCWLCQTEWTRQCMGQHWFG